MEPDFELAVIGGGIAGAAIARDAALRGFRTALFEKGTFGCGTSSKSSKLIHGGIRYLETAWLAARRGRFGEAWKNVLFVFSSLRESRLLRKIAPGLVEPHAILIPLYRSDKRPAALIYLGACLYSLMAMAAGHRKSVEIFPSAAAALRRMPELNKEGLKGAVRIWDHLVNDLALVRATIASARKNGARCEENAEVLSYAHDREMNAYTLSVKTPRGEEPFSCRKLVDASGAWVDELRRRGKEYDRSYLLPVAGSHVNVARFLSGSALLQAEDGRFFFVITHGDISRIGTTERLVNNVDKVEATKEEIDYLLRSVTRYFPGVALTKKDVLSADAGVRPLAASGTGEDPNRVSREHKIRVGPSGVAHVLGVKLTDHRRAAQEVLDRLLPSLLPFHPSAQKKSSTHKVPL